MKSFLHYSFFFLILLQTIHVKAWEGMPMPELRVEGRYLKDSHGHIVNLHGFGQTYSPWFNERGTKWDNYDVDACLKYNQGLIDKILEADWKMNFLRLHMDPYWSNTPGCKPDYHEAHNCFNEIRFRKYLDEVFVPMAEFALSKGLYVVMRPPGVSPENIQVGDDYHQYLIKVWGIVSKHPNLKDRPGIMFELANEPINIMGTDGTFGAGTQGHFDNLKTFFQTIVDTIRSSGNNILWVPGLGYQSLYAGYAVNPIESENIGYAVHVYPGWFNSGNGYEPFQRGWDKQVQPVADFAPIMVTEMDWAPERHDKSWGKDITGTAGGDGFGANFKKITDDCGNVSWMLFTGPELLAQFGDSTAPADVVDFLTDPEACPFPIYHWFQDYASEYGLDGVEDSYLEMTVLKLDGDTVLTVLNKSSVSLKINAIFADGHSENVASLSQLTVSNPDVVQVERGRIFSKKEGQASVQAAYTDTRGNKKEVSLQVVSTTFPLNEQLFNADIWENGTFDENTKTLRTGKWGFGGWQYDGIDLSGFKYIVVKLGSANNADVAFNIYDGPSYWGSPASYKFGSKREVVVNLNKAKKNDGKALNPEHIYIAGFWSNGNNPFVIDTVFLSNSSEYDPPVIYVNDAEGYELTSLSGFSYVSDSGPSACQAFLVEGTNISDHIKMTVPDGFELSQDSAENFTNLLTLYPEEKQVQETNIYVRLKAGLSPGDFAGNLLLSSAGASSKSVSLSGNVEKQTSFDYLNASGAEVVSVHYFTLSGQRIVNIENRKGLYIEKKIMSDGTVQTNKIWR
ncbi:glycoside hydrolase family 5 protein [Roseimarinus sediminis]|uniref:glycoside hydrolase family 5 protein n=1 Tax=Roseimarinus sediminis TaxID=1610899 RepID=UPI003D1FCF4C